MTPTSLGHITPRDIKRAEQALYEDAEEELVKVGGTVRTPLVSQDEQPSELGDPPGYVELREIMEDAFNFAARGKGHKRHGQNGEPWHEQRHARIGRALGEGFAIGQAMKKAEESTGLQDEAAIKELLGAMTYLASAIYIIREGHR